MPPELVEIGSLRKGDIITFYYGHGRDPRPIALFLNYHNGLVHAINLNYLSAGQVQYLKTILGQHLYTIHSIENPKDFYENELKKYGYSIAYRTYRPDKIMKLLRIGYKMNEIVKDAGLQQKDKEQEQAKKPIESGLIPKDIIPKNIIPTEIIPKNIIPTDIIPKNIIPKGNENDSGTIGKK